MLGWRIVGTIKNTTTNLSRIWVFPLFRLRLWILAAAVSAIHHGQPFSDNFILHLMVQFICWRRCCAALRWVWSTNAAASRWLSPAVVCGTSTVTAVLMAVVMVRLELLRMTQNYGRYWEPEILNILTDWKQKMDWFFSLV